MRNTTNALDASGESLLWNKLHRIRYLLGLMLCVTGISLNVSAAPSDLDLTFGNGGKAVSSPDGSQTTYGYGMALQPDGKIVMAGGYFNSPGNLGFIVTRYNADGSLDSNFGNNGWTAVTFGYSREAGTSVALQPDGKIVVGGPLYNGGIDIGIIRFNANGSLDTSFDGDGKVIINSGTDDEIFSLKIANDGKIVFAGDVSPTQLTFSTLLGRLNADGSRDTTFGTNGLLVGGSGRWRDLTLLPDGSMAVAGNISLQFSGFIIAAKYNNNGTTAWGYSQGGDFVSARLNGVATQPDGKIVMAGHYQSKIFATRLNADGTVDNSFNISATPPSGEAFSVAVQPDGKIVANISVNGGASFSLVRYNTNGSLDPGFGTGGIVTTNVGSGPNYGLKLLIQPDGKILVGGWSSSSGSPASNYFSMVRYKGGASVPAKTLFDYDGDGKADISVFRPSENKWYIQRSSDGQVTQQIFAVSGDIPVPSDYDGDGKTDMAIYRPSSSDWWSLSSVNGNQVYAHWGESGV
ncbi:MAG TPA: FG-GAP-like repeat-containing protein, partial [Pyrinomonadaceae bacterium]